MLVKKSVAGVLAVAGGSLLGLGRLSEAATFTNVATFPSGYTGGGLTFDQDGNLFGTAQYFPGSQNGCVFKVDLQARQLSSIAPFQSFFTRPGERALVSDITGNLYGYGRDGSIFALARGAASTTTLVGYTGNNSDTISALTVGPSGQLYGTGFFGGQNDRGTVFQFYPGASEVRTLASFQQGVTGVYPATGVIIGKDGYLYGTTSGSYGTGTYFGGTLFRANPATGELQTLVTFTGATGLRPQNQLVSDGMGHLFGTTNGRGIADSSIIFEYDIASGRLTTLASFSSSNSLLFGGPLLVDAAGNLFGVDNGGGPEGVGRIFKLPAGSHQVESLYDFSRSTEARPSVDLAVDPAGNLYGTAMSYRALTSGTGLVFQLSGTGFVVPEPSVAAFVSVAALGAAARRRR
jgi:uncharacterized repeat protein (TIGR03803 family)